jgi:putative membrane protein
MSEPPEPGALEAQVVDATRRTSLAAERTWLAWWRTGLGAAAVAIGVGRVLPSIAGGSKWELRALGLGYGALAVVVLLAGGIRQGKVAEALRRGTYDQLSSRTVMWFTAAAVGLALATLVVILVAL